jgi:hypothetical protein
MAKGDFQMRQTLFFIVLIALSVGGICLAQTGQNLIVPNTPDTVHKVQVSIVNVPFDMVKGDDGVWTYTSEPQAPGYHNYWMIVDGAIVLDPATQAFIGYSHMCNGFEVPDPGDFLRL